jgi:NAD(P)H-dependent FMN reductase
MDEPSTPSQPRRPLEVVGIAGSLRAASFNRTLLRAAVELAPPALHLVVHDLAAVPP